MSARRGRRRSIRLIAAIALFAGVLLPLRAAAAQPSSQTSTAIARLGVRVTSPAPSRTISGVVFAVDSAGRAVLDLEPQTLQASVDGKPVQLSSVGGRPSIALAAAFLLDSSASPRVRDSVANALADGVQAIDVNRDTVAIVSTNEATPWDQASFTTSAEELKQTLNGLIQTEPNDAVVSLEQVSASCAR